jgi:hypothetical protein
MKVLTLKQLPEKPVFACLNRRAEPTSILRKRLPFEAVRRLKVLEASKILKLKVVQNGDSDGYEISGCNVAA